MQVTRSRRAARSIAAALTLTLCAQVGGAAGFVANETVASPQRDLVDPEFNQARAQVVWSDVSGDLWVADVDRSNGNLVPANGKGVLIDRQSATVFDGDVVLTGPEWAWNAGTDIVVYTRYLPGKEHVKANARLATASRNADGSWSRTTLSPNVARHSPLGSESGADTAPRINYYDTQGYQYWREIARPETEEMLPAMDIASPQAARAVRGARALTYVIPVDGVAQVFRYDLDTKALVQLTFDAGAKFSPRMWQAPEFGNDFVLAAVVNRTTLRFYRQPGDGTSAAGWTVFRETTDATVGSLISIEPFVYGGRSYIVMSNADSIVSAPTSIWVANVDTTNPIFRRITPESPARIRTDPEVFVSDRGPVVYFNRFDPSQGPPAYCLKCSEGLYRADPGLAP